MGRQIRKPKVCFLRVLNVVFHIQFCEINLTDSLELVEGRWWALSFSNTWSEDLNCRDKRSFWVAEVFQVCIVLHWWISMVHIFCPNPCGRKHTLNYSCSLFIHTLLCRGGIRGVGFAWNHKDRRGRCYRAIAHLYAALHFQRVLPELISILPYLFGFCC